MICIGESSWESQIRAFPSKLQWFSSFRNPGGSLSYPGGNFSHPGGSLSYPRGFFTNPMWYVQWSALASHLERTEGVHLKPYEANLTWFLEGVSRFENGPIRIWTENASKWNHMEQFWYSLRNVYPGLKMAWFRSGQKRCPNEAIWIKSDIVVGKCKLHTQEETLAPQEHSLQTLCGMFNDLHWRVILREPNQCFSINLTTIHKF